MTPDKEPTKYQRENRERLVKAESMIAEQVSRCASTHTQINGQIKEVNKRIDKIYYLLLVLMGGVGFNVILNLMGN